MLVDPFTTGRLTGGPAPPQAQPEAQNHENQDPDTQHEGRMHEGQPTRQRVDVGGIQGRPLLDAVDYVIREPVTERLGGPR